MCKITILSIYARTHARTHAHTHTDRRIASSIIVRLWCDFHKPRGFRASSLQHAEQPNFYFTVSLLTLIVAAHVEIRHDRWRHGAPPRLRPDRWPGVDGQGERHGVRRRCTRCSAWGVGSFERLRCERRSVVIVIRLVGRRDRVRPLDNARRLGPRELGRVGPVVPRGGGGGGLGGEGGRGWGDVGVGPGAATTATATAAAFL